MGLSGIAIFHAATSAGAAGSAPWCEIQLRQLPPSAALVLSDGTPPSSEVEELPSIVLLDNTPALLQLGANSLSVPYGQTLVLSLGNCYDSETHAALVAHPASQEFSIDDDDGSYNVAKFMLQPMPQPTTTSTPPPLEPSSSRDLSAEAYSLGMAVALLAIAVRVRVSVATHARMHAPPHPARASTAASPPTSSRTATRIRSLTNPGHGGRLRARLVQGD